MPPRKTVITVAEVVLLSVWWSTCQNLWKSVVIAGITHAVRSAAPRFSRSYQDVIVGGVLAAALYSLILLTSNVDIGNVKVFELIL